MPSPRPLALLAALIVPLAAAAQETPPPANPPIALVNATVDGFEARVGILISNGTIRAVDPRARGLRGMRVLNLQGARVVAGRIDAWASAGSPDPLGTSLDAFDPFDQEAIREALAMGVTTIVLTPMRSGTNSGLATVLKLKPNGSLADRIVVEESAVCASLGLGRSDSVKRVGESQGLRKLFEAALAYRDAWDTYTEEVETYAEEVAKLPKELPKDPPKDAAKAPPAPKGAKPKKDAKPKKPKRPKVDRSKVLLVRVLDRELPLRVEAHRTSDIVNILELAEEFGFRLILEGASEAYLLADVLAKREVPVILGPITRSTHTSDAFPMRHTTGNAALLDAAGVDVALGSDAWPASRFMELNAHQAVSGGLDPARAEDAITHGIARMLGVGDRLGRVAVGYDADLVIMRRGPLGNEEVGGVLIDGQFVFERGAQ